MGTVYDEYHIDGAYAHVDRGEDEPGYLTGVFALTLPENVTTTPAATLVHGDVNLYAAGDTITLSYDGEMPAHSLLSYSVNGTAIDGDSFVMPFVDATVTLTITAVPRYTFDSSTGTLALNWGEFNKDDYWSDVTKSQVTSVTATDEVRFTGDCSKLFYGFYNCKSIDLSNVNTDSVTNMSSMFNGCSSLKTLDASGWDVGNVTNMTTMSVTAIASRHSTSVAGTRAMSPT